MNYPKITIDNIEYEIEGNIGCILSSREKNIKVGDVRMIEERLFYARYISDLKWLNTPRISWTIANIEIEEIRKIKAKLLGCIC